MEWSFLFFFNSIALGVGLAMDAFSVSLANGLAEPNMRLRKVCAVAGTFAGFQALMPMIGWCFVKTVAHFLTWFERCIPWIALLLLGFLGIKMLVEGIRNRKERVSAVVLTATTLLVQGVATSIDALSVGFTISEYSALQALTCALIIAIVTFALCTAALMLGKSIGGAVSGYATIAGGIILIGIGIEIFITNLF